MMNSINNVVENEIKFLVDEKKLSSGLSIVFGDRNNDFSFCYGSTGNNGYSVTVDTIVDLASVTKLFLSFAYFSLFDLESVDFSKSVSYYSSKFKNIGHITLNDLMHFNCVLKTEHRITNLTYEQAMDDIFNIKAEYSPYSLYSDMPAIVLGILFEKISSVEFGEYINRYIINKFNLKNTFWHTDKVFDNCFDYSGEVQIYNDKIIKIDNPIMLVNDVKARILSDNGTRLCGHAGIFSSANDMHRISRALLSGEIISKKSLDKIGTVINTNQEQRFGNMCYCKSPNPYLSEIAPGLGDNSFAISGFTGNYYCIAPQNELYMFIGANKLSNRVSKCNNDELLYKTGLVCSKDFVYEKDRLRDFGFKILMNQS